MILKTQMAAAQGAAILMGFTSVEQLADWTAQAAEPEAITAGYIFSAIGKDLLDQ